MKKISLIIMVILLIFVTAGCSSGEKSDTDKNTTKKSVTKEGKQKKSNIIDAEELLPKEDVEKVLGIEIKYSKHEDNKSLGMSGIIYYNEDSEKSVWIHCFQQPAVPKGDDYDVKQQYKENYESTAGLNRAEVLQDLGDEAYYDDIVSNINVRIGDYSFKISNSLSDSSFKEKKEMEIQLAKIVEENLKKKLEK